MASAEQLAADLTSQDVAVRRQAATQLATEPQAAAAVALALATADEDEAVREAASSALEDLGPPAISTAPALAKLLTRTEPDVLYWAATLLGRLGSAAAPHTAALATLLDSDHALPARERAAWALGEIGPAAHSAHASLTRAAASEHARLARLASTAMKQVAG